MYRENEIAHSERSGGCQNAAALMSALDDAAERVTCLHEIGLGVVLHLRCILGVEAGHRLLRQRCLDRRR